MKDADGGNGGKSQVDQPPSGSRPLWGNYDDQELEELLLMHSTHFSPVCDGRSHEARPRYGHTERGEILPLVSPSVELSLAPDGRYVPIFTPPTHFHEVEEVVERISVFLPGGSIANTRLVSRSWHTATRQTWIHSTSENRLKLSNVVIDETSKYLPDAKRYATFFTIWFVAPLLLFVLLACLSATVVDPNLGAYVGFALAIPFILYIYSAYRYKSTTRSVAHPMRFVNLPSFFPYWAKLRKIQHFAKWVYFYVLLLSGFILLAICGIVQEDWLAAKEPDIIAECLYQPQNVSLTKYPTYMKFLHPEDWVISSNDTAEYDSNPNWLEALFTPRYIYVFYWNLTYVGTRRPSICDEIYNVTTDVIALEQRYRNETPYANWSYFYPPTTFAPLPVGWNDTNASSAAMEAMLAGRPRVALHFNASDVPDFNGSFASVIAANVSVQTVRPYYTLWTRPMDAEAWQGASPWTELHIPLLSSQTGRTDGSAGTEVFLGGLAVFILLNAILGGALPCFLWSAIRESEKRATAAKHQLHIVSLAKDHVDALYPGYGASPTDDDEGAEGDDDSEDG